MAADNLLLERAGTGDTVFVRFYSWAPPAISSGYLQNPETILDKEALDRNGIGAVRRLTGGRAVLHWDDLTYACIFPRSVKSMGSTIHESYSIISRCLMHGLHLAGVDGEMHDSPAEYAATKRNMQLPCFLSPNRNEIMVGGRKLVGSAQKRTAAAVLQHGSIPLGDSFRRLPEFLLLEESDRQRQKELLEKKCVCINDIDKTITKDKLTDYLIRGFSETLSYSVLEKPWDDEELKEIARIG